MLLPASILAWTLVGSFPGRRGLGLLSAAKSLRVDGVWDLNARISGYSIFGIGVDRKHVIKWLFSKEKATLHVLQKVYVYSENALGSTNEAGSSKPRTRQEDGERPATGRANSGKIRLRPARFAAALLGQKRE